MGVGNVKAQAQGRGTVELESVVNRQTYILKLQDVLYIPTNKQNLISLGHWDGAGGYYVGGGIMNPIAKNGKHVATGDKINNNLYRMYMVAHHCNNKSPETFTTFVAEETPLSRDVWHKCLGHIGFSTLQNMLDKNLVDSFHVDEHTMRSDCQACVEAKQT